MALRIRGHTQAIYIPANWRNPLREGPPRGKRKGLLTVIYESTKQGIPNVELAR